MTRTDHLNYYQNFHPKYECIQTYISNSYLVILRLIVLKSKALENYSYFILIHFEDVKLFQYIGYSHTMFKDM